MASDDLVKRLRADTMSDDMESQHNAQLEGLAIGLERRGEVSAAHVIRLALKRLDAMSDNFHPLKNLPSCMMPDGGECCAGYAAVVDDWHKQRREIERLRKVCLIADDVVWYDWSN